ASARGSPGVPVWMRREADAMRACVKAGLRAPEVLLDDEGVLLGTAGLIMARVPGETLARRILRDDEYKHARTVLVDQLGEFLAGFHRIAPAGGAGGEGTDEHGRDSRSV